MRECMRQSSLRGGWQLERTNVFDRDRTQGQIRRIDGRRTPRLDDVTTFDQAFDLLVERSLAASAMKIVPDRYFHRTRSLATTRGRR